MKTRVIILVSLFLTSMAAQATGALSQGQTSAGETITGTTVDERLWATWGLKTAEITVGGNVKTYTLKTLLADRDNLPENVFLSLYFFDDQVGICISEKGFINEFDVNAKGSFSINNGELTIAIYEEQSHTFTYAVENDQLNVRYTYKDVQYNLTYKLIARNFR